MLWFGCVPVCVCVFFTIPGKPLFLPVDIQHSQCPCRCFNAKEIPVTMWSQNYATTAEIYSTLEGSTCNAMFIIPGTTYTLYTMKKRKQKECFPLVLKCSSQSFLCILCCLLHLRVGTTLFIIQVARLFFAFCFSLVSFAFSFFPTHLDCYSVECMSYLSYPARTTSTTWHCIVYSAFTALKDSSTYNSTTFSYGTLVSSADSAPTTSRHTPRP